MYTFKLRHQFCAAHQLTNAYSEECNVSVHGHTFKILVQIQVKELVGGMVVDFKKVKEVINQLDHKNLNEILDFEPTAENITKYLYDKIHDIPDLSELALVEVTIWESDNASITYSI